MPAATEAIPATPPRSSAGGDRLVDRVLVAFGRRDYRAEAAAFALALDSASDDAVPSVADQLITLSVDAGAHPAALDALGFAARAYSRLPPPRRQRLLATGHGRWADAVAIGLSGASEVETVSIASLIGDACDPLALPRLLPLLSSDHSTVRAAAGEALVTLAKRANRAPGLDELTRQSIEACIASAAADYDKHRVRETLTAVILLLSTPVAWAAIGPELAALLNDVQHPTHMALRSAIRTGADETMRAAAWTWLSRTPFRNACIERLSAPGEFAALEPMLAQGHLRLHPGRAAALAQARDRKRTDASLLSIADVSPLSLALSAAANALPILSAVNDDARPVLAEASLTDERPAVRASTLLELTRFPAGDDDLLLDFCFDAHPALARSAFFAAQTSARTGRLGADAFRTCLTPLANSEHAPLRALASLCRETETATTHRRARVNLDATVETLRTSMHTGPAVSRVAAIQSARALQIVAHVELELLGILDRSGRVSTLSEADRASELRVAATAAAALGDSPTPTAEHALFRCLDHADNRVRANALDALIRRSRRAGALGSAEHPLAPTIVELKFDDHHRVRAAATRGHTLSLLRLPSPNLPLAPIVEPISAMLGDDRPPHRLSALWLTERLAPALGPDWHSVNIAQSLWNETDRLTREDADPTIRERAAHTTGQLQLVLRTGWGERAGAMA
jgi:hypothetical protein